MSMTDRGIRTLGAMMAVAALAACGDTTGITSDYEPELTAEILEDGLEPLQRSSDLLLALDLVAGTLDWYGASGSALLVAPRTRPARAAHAAMGAGDRVAPMPVPPARPVRPGQDQGSPASALRADGTGAEATGALQWPAGVRGETFAWDDSQGYVPTGWSGAPTDGVRFLLYRMDASSGYPEVPLVQTGHVDLVPGTTAAGDAVRVRAVRTAGPDRVIADYEVETAWNGTDSEGGLVLTADGQLGDGAVVELGIRETYAWSAASDRYELTMEYSLRRGSTFIDLEARARAGYDAVEWERLDLDARFQGVGPVVDLDAEIGPDGRLDGTIRSDGRLAIRIGGYDGRPWFERADERGLSWNDEDALDRVWTGVLDLMWWVDWVLVPEELLYG